ncbi:MAG TPA: S9 family peptidase [Dehalococcoidia bacterium]|nr:S9 family peptidase [Dehalococcoidia bacterium]
MSDTQTRAYGLWESPLSPASLAQGKRLSEVAFDSDGRTAVWLEGRGDRGVLVASRDDDLAPRDLTDTLSVRATVGYGGGDFCVGGGAVIFCSGGRLYRQDLAGGVARPITPALGAVSSPRLSPDGKWVLFLQSSDRKDCLAVVDSDGEQWPAKLAQGRDFYMQPRWSHDGLRVAWIAWDHPNMPWDGTELWVAGFDAGDGGPHLREERCLAGGADVAIFQPEFEADGAALTYVADTGGWGQIYRRLLADGEARRLTGGFAEYGRPAWQQGAQAYAIADGQLAVVRSFRGEHKAQVVDSASGETRDLKALSGYTSVDFVTAAPDGGRLALVASGPTMPPRVISVELPDGPARTLARATGETVPPTALSRPEAVEWPSFDGETAHGIFYPPANSRFRSPGTPPLVALIHGGPTSQVTLGYNPQAQFLATRGYAVLLVNYRGSTGYGRDYMLKLRHSWGVYDVEDTRTGCLAMAERGLVDANKRVIMGGSAGGFTVLQSLVSHPGFYTAGACLFGVANQFTLVQDTHKFEERYSDSLLGPLPEAAALYRERSPVFHAERIKDPVIVFQGDIDQVVPPSQSEEVVASLRARGVPHEYHVFEGEGHGWRKTETVERFYTLLDRFLRQYVVFV